MTLAAEEFIRRFLLHTLPAGFQRIRHFGLLANRHREQRLALCRQLLTAPTADLLPPPALCRRLSQTLATRPPLRCPQCGAGRMIRLGFFAAYRWPALPPADSS
jgi:Putative transposase